MIITVECNEVVPQTVHQGLSQIINDELCVFPPTFTSQSIGNGTMDIYNKFIHAVRNSSIKYDISYCHNIDIR